MASERFGVVTFPGSNGDHDALSAIELGLGCEVAPIWHKDRSFDGFDALIVPGGFSYGDYLRAGAIARFSPIMEAVADFAKQGGPILGICNGFQILTEAGLLPGVLMRNTALHYTCKWLHIRIETDRTAFTQGLDAGELLHLPVAHGEGRYFASKRLLAELEANDQIVFRYVTPTGEDDPASNPNGSVSNIAGVCNRRGNVVGLMPHPDRAYDPAIGGDDGVRIFGAALMSRVASAVPSI